MFICCTCCPPFPPCFACALEAARVEVPTHPSANMLSQSRP